MRFRSAIAGLLLVAGSTLSAFAADPAATVKAFSQALMDGKSAEALAMFSADAGYAYSLDGTLNTGEKFRAWLQSDIVGPGSKFIIEKETVTGETVDTEVLWGRGTPATPARYVFEVKDGKIISWRMTNR
jgi:limonene-1,2-epoxide hydrolase